MKNIIVTLSIICFGIVLFGAGLFINKVESPILPVQTVKLQVEGVEQVKISGEDGKISRSMEVENSELQYSGACKIHDGIAYIAITSIGSWDSRNLWTDSKLLRKDDIKELVIYMNSPGGAAFQGMSIADELRIFKESGITITMEGRGLIASAALPIFVMGDKRIVSKNTIFMIHPASLHKWGVFTETLKDLKNQQKMIEMCQEAYANVVSECSNLTKEEVLEMMKEDTWITAKEALKMGFTDEIE